MFCVAIYRLCSCTNLFFSNIFYQDPNNETMKTYDVSRISIGECVSKLPEFCLVKRRGSKGNPEQCQLQFFLKSHSCDQQLGDRTFCIDASRVKRLKIYFKKESPSPSSSSSVVTKKICNPQSDEDADDDQDDDDQDDADILKRVAEDADDVCNNEQNKVMSLLYLDVQPGSGRVHVVIEFPTTQALRTILSQMKMGGWAELLKANSVPSSGTNALTLSLRELREYARPLIKDSNALEAQPKRPSFCDRDDNDKDNDTDILLIFPFNKQTPDIDRAAAGLTELGWISQGTSCTRSSSSRGRITITVSEYKLLEPPQYFNDSLIDFWHQWSVTLLNAKDHKTQSTRSN
jgi:hypothetical protein